MKKNQKPAEHEQQFFSFEEDMREQERLNLESLEKKAIEALPVFEVADTDNKKLFNLQKAYYCGDKTALQSMFIFLNQIAVKLIKKECRAHKVFYTCEKRAEIALDAATLMIEQFVKNRLKISTSFTAYLYLQVRKVMYTRTEAQKLEAYCRKYNIPLFELSESEKRSVKTEFEKTEYGVEAWK